MYEYRICHDGGKCDGTLALDHTISYSDFIDDKGCLITNSHKLWCDVHIALESKAEEPRCARAPEIDTPQAWKQIGGECGDIVLRKNVHCDCVNRPIECIHENSGSKL